MSGARSWLEIRWFSACTVSSCFSSPNPYGQVKYIQASAWAGGFAQRTAGRYPLIKTLTRNFIAGARKPRLLLNGGARRAQVASGCLRKYALLPAPPPLPLRSPSCHVIQVCGPGGQKLWRKLKERYERDRGDRPAPPEDPRYTGHCRFGCGVMTRPCLRTSLCHRSLRPLMALKVVLLPSPSLSPYPWAML